MAARIVSFEQLGLVARTRLGTWLEVAYDEILTAERTRAPRRGLRLHVRGNRKPISIGCGRNRASIESKLRERGVRIVDCWGCIIAPTLADFELELMNKPPDLRQLYDRAGS